MAVGIEANLLPHGSHLRGLDAFIVAVVPLPDLLRDQDTTFSAAEDLLSDSCYLSPTLFLTTSTFIYTFSSTATAAEQQLKCARRPLPRTDEHLAHASWVDELSAPDEQRPGGRHLAFAQRRQWDVRDARVLA